MPTLVVLSRKDSVSVTPFGHFLLAVGSSGSLLIKKVHNVSHENIAQDSTGGTTLLHMY